MFKEYKLILSLYDYTGEWAKPYIDAGYPVMLWDKKVEGDILDFDLLEDWLMGYQDHVYGILAAPPCTDFAGSGARWWKEKDKDQANMDISCALIELVMIIKDMCPNIKFWVLENPVGRIEKLIPELKPFRKLLFNPCDYGDAYTKKTILWGQFNHNLKKSPVTPEFLEYKRKDGSITRFAPQFGKSGGKSERTKEIRSATPKGFARAFFEANK
jgi:hypothetical protein